jgi:hypothetical protein
MSGRLTMQNHHKDGNSASVGNRIFVSVSVPPEIVLPFSFSFLPKKFCSAKFHFYFHIFILFLFFPRKIWKFFAPFSSLDLTIVYVVNVIVHLLVGTAAGGGSLGK